MYASVLIGCVRNCHILANFTNEDRKPGGRHMLNVVLMSHTQMAAQLARVLGHLTIVGVSSASLPVNFGGGMLSFGPYWGHITELMAVVSGGKDQDAG